MKIFNIQYINQYFKVFEKANSSTFYKLDVGASCFSWQGNPWAFSNEHVRQLYPYATGENLGSLSKTEPADALRIILDCFSFEWPEDGELDQNFSLQKTEFIFITLFSILRENGINNLSRCFYLEPSEGSGLNFYMGWGFNIILLDAVSYRGIFINANPIT